MGDKYTEEEQREIKLEAIVNAMYEGYQQFRNMIPITNKKMNFIDQVIDGLYNEAEVRADIADLIDMQIEFED